MAAKKAPKAKRKLKPKSKSAPKIVVVNDTMQRGYR